MKFLMATLALFAICLGCGVKGDPQPPEEPAYIGRGKPNFKKAVERFDIRTEEIEDEKDQEDSEQEDED